MSTQFGSGIAKADDGRAAGKTAAGNALEKLDGGEADFALVLSSSEYDYGDVVSGVQEAADVDRLIGASTAGEFTDEVVENGSVAVGLVRSDDIRFYTGMGEGVSEDVMGAVRDAAADLPREVDGHPYLVGINLHEGLSGQGESIALAAHQELGIPFSGGSAGDDMAFEETYVFTDEKVASDAVALAVLASKKPLPQSVNHGHEPISEPMTVTKAEGGTVHELDGRPAIEAWKDAIREPAKEKYGIDVDELEPDDDRLMQLFIRFEFGIETDQENYKVRWPGPTFLQYGLDGPMAFAVEMPEGAVLKVMDTTDEAQISSPRKAAEEAVRDVDGRVAGAFVFECACHANILGDDFYKGVDALKEGLGAPFVGFEAYGEVCLREGDLSGYHNTTTSILVLPE